MFVFLEKRGRKTVQIAKNHGGSKTELSAVLFLVRKGPLGSKHLPSAFYPWGRLDYIRNLKTIKSVSVSVTFWKLIRKQFKSVSVTSGV